MIVAAAAALALAAPSREGLIERWLRANPAHSAARLESAPRVALPLQAPPNLGALARRELGIAGRYQLAEPFPAVAATEPWWLRVLRWLGDCGSGFGTRFLPACISVSSKRQASATCCCSSLG